VFFFFADEGVHCHQDGGERGDDEEETGALGVGWGVGSAGVGVGREGAEGEIEGCRLVGGVEDCF